MSDPATPTVAPGTAGGPVLSAEAIAAVLDDFRTWLEQAAEAGQLPTAAVADRPPIDLHTLVGHFVALRHEVNLQTRASRAQQEQSRESLDQLQKTVATLTEARGAQEQLDQFERDEGLRPILGSLLDLADAFRLSHRELLRGRQALEPVLASLARPAAPLPRLAGLASQLLLRLSGSARPPEAVAAPLAREASPRVAALVDSLLDGYAMSLRRLERVLQQHDLECFASVGERFDPERMEVVEAVADSGRPPGEVVGEVRAGYLWRGRVFRCALVRVASGNT